MTLKRDTEVKGFDTFRENFWTVFFGPRLVTEKGTPRGLPRWVEPSRDHRPSAELRRIRFTLCLSFPVEGLRFQVLISTGSTFNCLGDEDTFLSFVVVTNNQSPIDTENTVITGMRVESPVFLLCVRSSHEDGRRS